VILGFGKIRQQLYCGAYEKFKISTTNILDFHFINEKLLNGDVSQ
jgi:hypothetical protein